VNTTAKIKSLNICICRTICELSLGRCKQIVSERDYVVVTYHCCWFYCHLYGIMPLVILIFLKKPSSVSVILLYCTIWFVCFDYFVLTVEKWQDIFLSPAFLIAQYTLYSDQTGQWFGVRYIMHNFESFKKCTGQDMIWNQNNRQDLKLEHQKKLWSREGQGGHLS